MLTEKQATSDDEPIYGLEVGESCREGIYTDSSSAYPHMLVIPKLISSTNTFWMSLPLPTGGRYVWISSHSTQSTPKPDLPPRLRTCSRPEFLVSKKTPLLTPLTQARKQEFLLYSSLYLISLCLPAPLTKPCQFHELNIFYTYGLLSFFLWLPEFSQHHPLYQIRNTP